MNQIQLYFLCVVICILFGIVSQFFKDDGLRYLGIGLTFIGFVPALNIVIATGIIGAFVVFLIYQIVTLPKKIWDKL